MRGDASSWAKVLCQAGFGNGGSVPETNPDSRTAASDAAASARGAETWAAYTADRPWVALSPDEESLYVADTHNHRIRVVHVGAGGSYGSTSLVAGSGTAEYAEGVGGAASFYDPRGLALSPDGDVVACGSQDNSVHFWRRSTGQDSMMGGYPAKPSALAFDDTGSLLATGGGDTVVVWNFEGDGPEGTKPGYLEVHDQLITTVAWACRGRCLASGGRDCTVAVWSIQRGGQGDSIGGALLADTVSDLYWRPDGRALVALDGQGGVTAWRVGSA